MAIHPKSPSWKTAASEGALPLELFQMAFQTAKAAYVAAAKGNERLACLQGLGTIQNMTSALAGIAPEHGDNLQAIGTKAMRLLPVIKAEAVKEDVLHKSAAHLVPIEQAQKGDMVEIAVGDPWPNSPKKVKVTGKVVRVKKDGVVTVDVSQSSSNPGGHSNEDVGYIDVRLSK